MTERKIVGSDTTESDSMLPVWLDDTHIDPAWLLSKTDLAKSILSCSCEDVSNELRKGDRVRDGATLRLKVEFEGDDDDDELSSLRLILKQEGSNRQLSRQLGLPRESLFYAGFHKELPPNTIPKIYYAAGDMKTGAKVVVMEDLSDSTVDSGIFFGPGNPNNWKRDLPAMIAAAGYRTEGVNKDNESLPPPPASHEVALTTFTAIARIHALFWRRQELLSDSHAWLRGHNWLQGRGKETWEASQNLVRTIWNAYRETEKESGAPLIKWDPLVKAAAAKSVEGISWQAQQERLHVEGSWTLVHGDFWPGNIMWVTQQQQSKQQEGSIRVLDWEMTGLGSGPQDLGQYVLSNMDPIERKAHERELVEAYHRELITSGVTDVSWDCCWREYKIGGVERFLWFLVYFLGQESSVSWAQFFHDQIAAFMHDHGLTAESVMQPRP